MGEGYCSIFLSNEIPRNIHCKDILTSLSKQKSLPEELDIQGHRLYINYLPSNTSVFKLYETDSTTYKPNKEISNDISQFFLGTIYVNACAPSRRLS